MCIAHARWILPVSLCSLLLPGTDEARAAVLTVGPNGQYAHLQAALDVAATNGEDDNIRIQSGILATSGAQIVHAENRYLEITGGWAADFQSGGTDPGLTVLSGANLQRALVLSVSAGTVVIRQLSLAKGRGSSGAGLEMLVSQSARVEISDCVVRDNVASAGGATVGGGMRLTLNDQADVQLERCSFLGNAAQAGVVRGAGLQVSVNDGRLRAQDLSFEDNLAAGATSAFGGAVAIDLGGADGQVELYRLAARGNLVDSVASPAGAGLYVQSATGTQQFLLEGAQFANNAAQGNTGFAAQLSVQAQGGTYRLRSIALVDGAASGGFRASVDGSAQVVAAHLTVAGNDGEGYRQSGNSSATQALQNSLLWGNGQADLSVANAGTGGFQSTFNAVGADPGVVDAATGNYRLAAGSVHINAAWPQPIAGLGTIDAAGAARVSDVQPDRGAYEFQDPRLFASGFETD